MCQSFAEQRLLTFCESITLLRPNGLPSMSSFATVAFLACSGGAVNAHRRSQPINRLLMSRLTVTAMPIGAGSASSDCWAFSV